MVAVSHRIPLRVTAGDWDALVVPDSYRAEIIQGELVLSPSPNRIHQRCVMNLASILRETCPPGFEVLPDLEWRRDEVGFVAQAPRPDLLVVPIGDGPVTEPPLLVVEVLSPSDVRQLDDSRMSRIDGKIADYTASGLHHYLEIDPLETVTAQLFDLTQPEPETVQEQRVFGDQEFATETPFPFRFRPSNLIRQ